MPSTRKIGPEETRFLVHAYARRTSQIRDLGNNLLSGETPMVCVRDVQKIHLYMHSVVEALEIDTSGIHMRFPLALQIELIGEHNELFAAEMTKCKNLIQRMFCSKSLTDEALETLRMLTDPTIQNGGSEREIFAVQSLPLYYEFGIVYRTKVLEGTNPMAVKILVDSCKEHRMILDLCALNSNVLKPLAENQREILAVNIAKVETVDKAHYQDLDILRQALVLWSESPQNGDLSTFKACLEAMILL